MVACKTGMEIVQIICDHRILMPVVLKCVVNAVEMKDIFPYHLSFFVHNWLNRWYILGHKIQQYLHITIDAKFQKIYNYM